MRHVGVEIEFMGLGTQAAALALQATFGGAVTSEDRHAHILDSEGLGRMLVELDVRYVHPGRRDRSLPVRLPRWAGSLLGTVLTPFVPRELVMPPLRVAELPVVDRAVATLRAAGASGDGSRHGVGLGLHFNVEPPDLKVATILRYLRAYLRLEPRLRREILAGGRHRLAAAFPQGYAELVLAPGYRPGPIELVADYLSWNPTRDRGLDLLPIFLHLEPARVRAVLPHAKIGTRPVLHNRLPLARVGVPGWSIWVAVERLALGGDGLPEADAAVVAVSRLPAGPG